VLKTIKAVRCYRGYTKKYKFYPSDDVALVSYYRSNRGVHYIRVLWKPESVDVSNVIEAARKALGLYIEAKLVIEGEEVKEIIEDE
jgi:hypothetical protein